MKQKKIIFLDEESWISEVTQWKGLDKLIKQNEEAQKSRDKIMIFIFLWIKLNLKNLHLMYMYIMNKKSPPSILYFIEE